MLSWQELQWTSSLRSLRSSSHPWLRHGPCGEIGCLSQQTSLAHKRQNDLWCAQGWNCDIVLFMIDLSLVPGSSSWVSGKRISLYNSNSPIVTKVKHRRWPRWQGPWHLENGVLGKWPREEQGACHAAVPPAGSTSMGQASTLCLELPLRSQLLIVSLHFHTLPKASHYCFPSFRCMCLSLEIINRHREKDTLV